MSLSEHVGIYLVVQAIGCLVGVLVIAGGHSKNSVTRHATYIGYTILAVVIAVVVGIFSVITSSPILCLVGAALILLYGILLYFAVTTRPLSHDEIFPSGSTEEPLDRVQRRRGVSEYLTDADWDLRAGAHIESHLPVRSHEIMQLESLTDPHLELSWPSNDPSELASWLGLAHKQPSVPQPQQSTDLHSADPDTRPNA